MGARISAVLGTVVASHPFAGGHDVALVEPLIAGFVKAEP
jgi:hypothetical protein